MVYLIEKYRRQNSEPRIVAFSVSEGGEHDIVSLDMEEPHWQPSVITVDSQGEVTKMTWCD